MPLFRIATDNIFAMHETHDSRESYRIRKTWHAAQNSRLRSAKRETAHGLQKHRWQTVLAFITAYRLERVSHAHPVCRQIRVCAAFSTVPTVPPTP